MASIGVPNNNDFCCFITVIQPSLTYVDPEKSST